MINPSEKWKEVEEKLTELRGLVEENWNNGEWQLALRGEHIIKTVEKSRAEAAELRARTNTFIRQANSLYRPQ